MALLVPLFVLAVLLGPLPPSVANDMSDQEATLISGRWSLSLRESAGIDFDVPAGQVMTGRQHSGDENGNTRYHSSQVWFQGNAVTTNYDVNDDGLWSDGVTQSNHMYVCPDNKVLTGRSHQGDENGSTKFRCASRLYWNRVRY